jgi:uncharacterized protein YgfB (UPF0149 family)
VLTDLIKIAEVRPPVADAEGPGQAPDVDDDQAEGAEADYMEILEYVRVAVMTLRWSVTEEHPD